jgi:hypothetical protein
VLIHRSLKDEERKGVFDGEQRALVLSARESEKADLGVLSRGASDPGVLGELGHLVWMCDARLDEDLGGLAPRPEVVCEQAGDEVDDPGVGDLSVHASPRETSGDYDARDGIRPVVTQNVGGYDSFGILSKIRDRDRRAGREWNVTANAPICADLVRAVVIGSPAPNVPSADERFDEFIFVDDSLEVIGVSLREIVLSVERLSALALPAGVIADLVKEMTGLVARKGAV